MANLNDFQEQLDILNATKTSIKEAIISKGQDVSSEDSFSSYADKIDDIVTLEEGTADANANADDILLDKTAYVNGQKVTGTLEIADAVSINNSDNTDTNLMLMNIDDIPSVVVGADINDLYGVKKVVEDGVGLEIIAPQSQFADVISLTTDKIKAGETILGVSGKSTIVDTEDASNMSANLIPNDHIVYCRGNKITGTMPFQTTFNYIGSYRGLSSDGIMFGRSNVNFDNPVYIPKTSSGTFITTVPRDVIADSIGLTASKMPVGVSILGIDGTYTNDATATADNIVAYKTAYVNGNKVVGNMHYAGGTISGQTYHRFQGTSFDLNLSGFPKSLVFNTDDLTLNGYIPAGRYVQVWADIDALNSYIGLTADKIKQGETILGITGTYTGSAMKEYASETAMNNDIANIQEGEVVKVVVTSGIAGDVDNPLTTTITHYIKETTMKKLVKEVDIS